MQRLMVLLGIFGLTAAGCNVEAPFDPGRVIGNIAENIADTERAIGNALADPLEADPFPVLLGSSSARVFYATNLTDIRVRFRGPTNDIVIPGILGPTNLYSYETQREKRQLLRPLAPSFASDGINAIDTDGDYVAFVSITGLRTSDPHMVLDAGTVFSETSRLFDASLRADELVFPHLVVDNGRLAYILVNRVTQRDRLRVVDLTAVDPTWQFSADRVGDFEMSHERLVYVVQDGGVISVIFRDLRMGAEIALAVDIRATSVEDINVAIANNTIVWSEPLSDGPSRIMAYDVPTGETWVWVDAVDGRLAGASDTHFVTQQRIIRVNKDDKIEIRRYDAEGKSKELADFSADGQAGQARVLGNFAAWVNPKREVVLSPLTGGDKIKFDPF